MEEMSCSLASCSNSIAAAASSIGDTTAVAGGSVALFDAWWETANSKLDEKGAVWHKAWQTAQEVHRAVSSVSMAAAWYISSRSATQNSRRRCGPLGAAGCSERRSTGGLLLPRWTVAGAPPTKVSGRLVKRYISV
jgi:hypothetical protein